MQCAKADLTAATKTENNFGFNMQKCISLRTNNPSSISLELPNVMEAGLQSWRCSVSSVLYPHLHD